MICGHYEKKRVHSYFQCQPWQLHVAIYTIIVGKSVVIIIVRLCSWAQMPPNAGEASLRKILQEYIATGPFDFVRQEDIGLYT